ncbi:YchJ family protein [Shewanella psychrotolerans]|uniref:YchJ family protein n=1 Tax=Shewanella psychrotolerans TaxID=2864206 RepID=UPI001C65C1DE|nr:YchJ family protein [Shewanella psychrotolerans]QYJ99907.1 YchJ family protein [Shewanella psychrotolerans]
MNSNQQPCPCGRQITTKSIIERLSYENCCQPYHRGARPQTPELLMRSRYSAFVLKIHDYLIETHDSRYLNGLTTAILDQDNHTNWLGLTINNCDIEGNTSSVEFHAWYNEGGIEAIHEISQFVKQGDRWLYTTGEQLKTVMPKRNDPCICNSGKKFKQCCSK